MEELLTSVNAEQVSDEGSHTEQAAQAEPTAQPVIPAEEAKPESVKEEAATPQGDKTEQSPEENSAFAAQRRAREAAEAKAAKLEADYQIAREFGSEYGVYSNEDIKEKFGAMGIETAEQLKAAIERERMAKEGLDPDLIEKKVKEHPLVKKAEADAKRAENFAEYEKWYRETIDEKFMDIKDIPKPVMDAFNSGKSMKTAYIEYAFEKRLKQEKTEKANVATAAASTGSAKGEGPVENLELTDESIAAMTDKQRISRWADIKAHYKMK